MLIRQRKWQNVPVLTTLVALAGLLLSSASASAQTSGGSSSSSGSSLLGCSSGSSSSGSSSGSSSSLSGSSGSGIGGTTNSLTNGANTLTNAGLGLSTTNNYSPTTNGVGPSATNILAPYYVNPLAGGLPNYTGGSTTGGTANTTKRFGQPLFANANNNLSSASAGRGAGGAGGRGNSAMSTGAAVGMSVGPRYTQTLGWKPTIAGGTRLQTNLQGLLARSTTLPNAKNFQVSLDGQTVVLRGTAGDDHERRLAAAILSMESGVYGLRNEIKVQPATQADIQNQPGTGSAPATRQP
ncbi:hypothetical protein BH10PLA2_BH10PLA2_32300 [soil metagenome]